MERLLIKEYNISEEKYTQTAQKGMMTYEEALHTANACLLPVIAGRYGLEDYDIMPVAAHDGGRNLVYCCEKENRRPKIIRIAFLPDRTRADLLAELEYVRYLAERGGGVSNVVSSRNGRMLEELEHGGRIFFACVFQKAKGKLLADNGYRYREGVPLDEYFFNCGKVLGRLHRLSKEYVPTHRRYGFFDRFNEGYINELIPETLPSLRRKLTGLLETLAGVERNGETFGMVHFDYNDGNYCIDFADGSITVFDFDNACFCWYLYDLACVWTHGTGWIQWEPDAGKRRIFMESYFKTAVAGYRWETPLEDAALDMLPLFIDVTIMEHILDEFEGMRRSGETPGCDGELTYLIKCLEADIPYKGFFSDIYSCEEPFSYEEHNR